MDQKTAKSELVVRELIVMTGIDRKDKKFLFFRFLLVKAPDRCKGFIG